MLSFGVLIAFWSPKQSEIEESSLESISKSIMQGVWDPAHSTRMGIIAHSTRVGIPSGRHHYIRLPSTFHPGCPHSEFCCRRHSTRMFRIWNSDARWERRVFQLSRSHISGSAYSAYPESFAAILHSAAMFSWSFPICATNILRYFEIFCFRYFEIFLL